MNRKDFFKDENNISIITEWSGQNTKDILAKWNKEVPYHVQEFNKYDEDRSAVIYFSLFVEYHVNITIGILFPDFDSFLANSSITTRINILASFRILPKQIFEACRCINNIRNEFAHEFNIKNMEQLATLDGERKKKTVDKLTMLTNDFFGDYEYERTLDTIRNRFKSLCLNTVTAFRIYEPQILIVRENLYK